MLFPELRFLFFFAAVFLVHWALRWNTARKVWLLAASYAFYAAWDWRFLSLILVSTIADDVAGRRIGLPGARRRLWLALSLCANLGILGFFKYFNFFLGSAIDLAGWLGLEVSERSLAIVLPVGISFYTFQTLSYTLDRYSGAIAKPPSHLDFALFVGFFPQLVAGPIMRAIDFLPQLGRRVRFREVAFRSHLTLFLLGYVKKAVLADQVARVLEPVFASPETFGVLDAWLGVALFSLQVYCDFSGYSDMAIATAGLLGYRLMLNFDSPYVAASVRDLWQRWHISMSTWFRDYVYIRLGGSRGSRFATSRNLLVTFGLCGLWHGAAWTYVVWGLWNGLFLVLERFVPLGRVPLIARRVYVTLVWLLGLALFRSPDLPTAGTYLGVMFGLGGEATAPERPDPRFWLLFLVFTAAHFLCAGRALDTRTERIPAFRYAIAYGLALALALPFAAREFEPFVYFQF